jgi:hypothetical protein
MERGYLGAISIYAESFRRPITIRARDQADFGGSKEGKGQGNAGCHFSLRKSDSNRGIEPDEEACEPFDRKGARF